MLCKFGGIGLTDLGVLARATIHHSMVKTALEKEAEWLCVRLKSARRQGYCRWLPICRVPVYVRGSVREGEQDWAQKNKVVVYVYTCIPIYIYLNVCIYICIDRGRKIGRRRTQRR